MKRNFIYYMALLAMSACVFASCATQKSHNTVTVSPVSCTLTPDSTDVTRLNVTFNIPGRYFSRRSRLVISPQLMVGDTVLDEYTPLILDAPIYSKKKHRKEVLHGYVDLYDDLALKVKKSDHAIKVDYNQVVEIPDGIDNARIMGIVSTDGCGQCTGVDTIDIANISVPATLIDIHKEYNLSWIEPEFKIRPKVHHGKGEARLQFIVDKWDIVMNLADNRTELTGMLETLRPILMDSLATLTGLGIFGSASAEASYSHNMMLAEKRANSAKNWLVSQLSLPLKVQCMIKTGAAPEGWEPVVQAMVAANDPDSSQVRALMLKYPGPTDDAAEKYIRKLACWSRIKNNYLAKDRKVLYDYTWIIKSFTNDSELMDMYGKRPDAFNEEEMLRVSTLVADDRSRIPVYETILKYFPDSRVAANNLAILYIKEGRADDAHRVLEGQRDFTPEMLNTLAASYVFANDYERAIELLQDMELPKANYNLGLLKAKQRKLTEAYELLRPFADVNSAIAALSVNRYDEARKIMAVVTDSTPIAEYVRAMIAARFGNTDNLYVHLAHAVANDRLRRRAVNEIDFFPYRSERKFIDIITK